MGQRGPKPKPRSRAEGGPGKRSPISHRKNVEPARIGAAKAPRMPATLPTEAKAVWQQLRPHLVDAGLLREVDGIALEALCICVTRFRQARKEIKDNGLLVVGSKGQVMTNPAVRIEREAASQIASWCDRFGLDPLSRTRLGLKGVPGETPDQQIQRRIGETPRLRAVPDAKAS